MYFFSNFKEEHFRIFNMENFKVQKVFDRLDEIITFFLIDLIETNNTS